jgi:hypothetical protein
VRRLLIHSTGWLSLLALNAAMAQPLGGGTALTVPTPEGPKLKLPQIEPAEPSLMLDPLHPLQMQPQRQPPSLGLLPDSQSMEALPPQGEPENPGPDEAPPAIYLEHDR